MAISTTLPVRDQRREGEVEWTCYYDVKTKNAWSSGEMWKSSKRVNVPSAHAFTQNIFGVLIASIKAWFNDGQSYDTVSFFLSELWRWEIDWKWTDWLIARIISSANLITWITSCNRPIVSSFARLLFHFVHTVSCPGQTWSLTRFVQVQSCSVWCETINKSFQCMCTRALDELIIVAIVQPSNKSLKLINLLVYCWNLYKVI